MKYAFPITIFLVLNLFSFAFAEQIVGGLQVDSQLKFQPRPDVASKWLAKWPSNVRSYVLSMEIFFAPSSNGIDEIQLMKIKYKPQQECNIDGAASESMQRVLALAGIKNLKHHIVKTKVSRHDGRRVSFVADRWGAKLGGEILVIYDRRTNTMWQMMLFFSKKKGLNPFKSLNMNKKREYANSLLNRVRLPN